MTIKSTVLVRGFVAVEYLMILFLVVLAVVVGRPSALERLISALHLAYQRFSLAMSLS
jgi:hypothetical protein